MNRFRALVSVAVVFGVSGLVSAQIPGASISRSVSGLGGSTSSVTAGTSAYGGFNPYGGLEGGSALVDTNHQLLGSSALTHGYARVSSQATLTYYLRVIDAPVGTAVNLTFNSGASVETSMPSGSASAIAYLFVGNYTDSSFSNATFTATYLQSRSETDGYLERRNTFQPVTHLTTIAGQDTIKVIMNTQASAQTLLSSASGMAAATVDPYFTIDGPDLGYHLEFSPGVGNNPPAATPEPGTLLLTGVGIAVFARPRRR